MKIISIMPHLANVKSEDEFIGGDWHFATAQYLKKYFNLNIECWRPIYFNKEIAKESDSITCRGFPGFKIRNEEITISLIKKLKEFVLKEEIIIHLNNMKSFYSGLIPIIFKNIPIVIQDYGQSPPRGINRKIIERISFKNIDYFFTATKKYENYLKSFVPENKITFQCMGVDMNIFKPINMLTARQQLGLENNKKLLLTVASLTKKKNIVLVIKALPHIIRKFPDVLYLIIGQGPEKENLKKLALNLNVLNNIRFCETVDNNKLPLYYSAVDLFVLPSFYEGFSVAKMEALSCNCKILIPDNFENKWVVRNEENGLIFKANSASDLEEKIIYFFNNQNKFNGDHRKIIEMFSWKNIVKKIAEVYDKLALEYYQKSLFNEKN